MSQPVDLVRIAESITHNHGVVEAVGDDKRRRWSIWMDHLPIALGAAFGQHWHDKDTIMEELRIELKALHGCSFSSRDHTAMLSRISRLQGERNSLLDTVECFKKQISILQSKLEKYEPERKAGTAADPYALPPIDRP